MEDVPVRCHEDDGKNAKPNLFEYTGLFIKSSVRR